VSERLEGPTETSRAGSIVLTTTATNTGGKRRTPVTTPGKREKKENCQRITEENKGREKL